MKTLAAQYDCLSYEILLIFSFFVAYIIMQNVLQNVSSFRMYILLGKYESNAIALKLSSDTSQEMIEKYESLVTLLSQQRSESAIVR